jgi:hypothetical protein
MSKRDSKELVVRQIEMPLNACTLGLWTSLFKLRMRSHSKAAVEEPKDKNLVIKLWEKIGSNALELNCLRKFIKIAEIAITAVLRCIEDKRTFLTLDFMKSKLCN